LASAYGDPELTGTVTRFFASGACDEIPRNGRQRCMVHRWQCMQPGPHVEGSPWWRATRQARLKTRKQTFYGDHDIPDP
jgi:hypothetical protein